MVQHMKNKNCSKRQMTRTRFAYSMRFTSDFRPLYKNYLTWARFFGIPKPLLYRIFVEVKAI